MIGTIVLTSVTDGLSDLSDAVVAAAPTVIASALAVGAIFYGGKALWRFFKGMAR